MRGKNKSETYKNMASFGFFECFSCGKYYKIKEGAICQSCTAKDTPVNFLKKLDLLIEKMKQILK